MYGEGQKVHGSEQHGEVLLAVAEVVLEMIAVVFEDVEALVFDFPARPGAGGDLCDGVARDLERGDEGAVVGRFPLASLMVTPIQSTPSASLPSRNGAPENQR